MQHQIRKLSYVFFFKIEALYYLTIAKTSSNFHEYGTRKERILKITENGTHFDSSNLYPGSRPPSYCHKFQFAAGVLFEFEFYLAFQAQAGIR